MVIGERKVQSRARYLWAFLIGTGVFILVFLVSTSIEYFEFFRVANIQDDFAYRIFQDKLNSNVFGDEICADESYRRISEDLGYQGRLIDDLERKLGKNNKLVLDRKKFYTLIELEHFEFVQMINRECSNEINTILFFYSNTDNELERSEDAGKLLGSVYERNKNLVIYSFDINLETELISKLRDKYGIEKSPSIVINDDYLVVGPFNLENIENYLSK